MNDIKFLTFDELMTEMAEPVPAETAERRAELRYRVGYLHGYGAAMDALVGSVIPARWVRVAEFFDDALTPWRESNPADAMTHPPQFSDHISLREIAED